MEKVKRKCRKCKQIYRISEFQKFSSCRNKIEIGRICRHCRNKDVMNRYWKHREHNLIHMREYRIRRKSHIREQRRRHYLLHREELKKRCIDWQKKNKEKIRKIRNKYHRRIQVRAKTGWAVTTGKLIPQRCENCGRKKAHAHHDDYSKPFQVRWLCSACHSAFHRGLVPLHQIPT